MVLYDNSIRDLISAHPHALAEWLLETKFDPADVRYGPTPSVPPGLIVRDALAMSDAA